MNNYIRVLIYSKFSPSCKIILDILDQNISLKKSIVFVCIDNAEIRQQIKTDPNLKISIVPCFLHIYDENGYVEMFEGEGAFNLLDFNQTQPSLVQPSLSSLVGSQTQPSVGSQIHSSLVGSQTQPSIGSTQIQSPYVGSTQTQATSVGSTQIQSPYVGSTQTQPSSTQQPSMENRDVTFLSSVMDHPEERPRGPLNLTQMASKMQKERESSDIQPQFGPRKN